MAILIDSKTATDDKDFWATTWPCFFDAQALYGKKFQLDVAAEPLTAKVGRYYTNPGMLHQLLLDPEPVKAQLRAGQELGNHCVGIDALSTPWDPDWWCNPPFSLKLQFIRAARRAQATNRPGMMLLPYEPLSVWWQDNLGKGCIIFEPKGRYQFYERDGITRKDGSNFGSALVMFPAPAWNGDSIRIPYVRDFWKKKKK